MWLFSWKHTEYLLKCEVWTHGWFVQRNIWLKVLIWISSDLKYRYRWTERQLVKALTAPLYFTGRQFATCIDIMVKVVLLIGYCLSLLSDTDSCSNVNRYHEWVQVLDLFCFFVYEQTLLYCSPCRLIPVQMYD